VAQALDEAQRLVAVQPLPGIGGREHLALIAVRTT
jgi:hypothetical protein